MFPSGGQGVRGSNPLGSTEIAGQTAIPKAQSGDKGWPFDSSRHSTRECVVAPAHLSGMNDETVCPTDSESNLPLSELAARLGVSAQIIYDLRSRGRGVSKRMTCDARREADGERRAPAHCHRHLRHRRRPTERSRPHRLGAVPRRRRTAPTGDGIAGFPIFRAPHSRGDPHRTSRIVSRV